VLLCLSEGILVYAVELLRDAFNKNFFERFYGT